MATKKTGMNTPFAPSPRKIVITKKNKQQNEHDPFDAFVKQILAQQEAQDQEQIEAEYFHLQTVWAGKLLLRGYDSLFSSPYLAHMCTAFALGDPEETTEDDLDRLDFLIQQQVGCRLDELEVPTNMLADACLICSDCVADMNSRSAGMEH